MVKIQPMVGGMIGAVLGFVATMLLLVIAGFGNRNDPITTGMIALFLICPLGAIGGLILGTSLAMRMRGDDSTGLVRNSLKALGLTVVTTAVIGGAVSYYYVATATPWLKPAGVILQFEVRLPTGAAFPASAKDVKIDLQTDINTMPAELRQLRRDGDRAVIAGEVDLAYRTAYRQLEVKIAGQPERVYPIKLTDKAPHARELGPWQPLAGGEIRYRAKWPGED